jgi:hypothetical protein
MDIISATEATIMELEGGFQMCLVDAKLDENQVNLNCYRAVAIIEQSEGRAVDLCHRYYTQTAREFDRRPKRVFTGSAKSGPTMRRKSPFPIWNPRPLKKRSLATCHQWRSLTNPGSRLSHRANRRKPFQRTSRP